MPVIRLFFEKFSIPSEVYVNGKVTLPKSWPLYSIFLNTNLSSSFLSVVFFGIVTFIKGFEDDKLKLLFIIYGIICFLFICSFDGILKCFLKKIGRDIRQ